MSLFIRTVAVFIYALAIMLGLKSFTDLMTGTAGIQGHRGMSLLLLAIAIIGAVGVWFVDRKFCRADRAGFISREKNH